MSHTTSSTYQQHHHDNEIQPTYFALLGQRGRPDRYSLYSSKMKLSIKHLTFLAFLVHVEAFVLPIRSTTSVSLSPKSTCLISSDLPKVTRNQQLGATSITSGVLELSKSAFASSGVIPLPQAIGVNAVLFALASGKLFSMLTPSGFVTAFGLGVGLWTTLGWKGWSVCVLYLLLGNFVTKVKFAEKEKRGLAEGRGGRRGPENVFGSAFTGLVCAFLSIWKEKPFGISSSLLVLAYVASLATKLADTFASEIGKAYGKTTFLITTLKRVEPGTEGAISLEGTVASVLGGFLLSIYSYGIGLISLPGVGISVIAAFLATNAESLIGATLQEREGFKWMTNEVVNFLNTLIGAVIAIGAGKVLL